MASLTDRQRLKFYKDKGRDNKIKKIILKNVRKKQHIIHGARALNEFFPPFLDRPTEDYDVFSSTPKRTAEKVEKRLDKRFGGDFFRTEPARFLGTVKVKSNVTERTIADYTKPKGEISHTKRRGIKYANFKHFKRRIKESLADPKNRFRHDKDKETLRRIKFTEKLRTQKRRRSRENKNFSGLLSDIPKNRLRFF